MRFLPDMWNQPFAVFHVVSVFAPEFLEKHFFLDSYSVHNNKNYEHHREETIKTVQEQGNGKITDYEPQVNWVSNVFVNAMPD